jgi:hypothetical protein
MIGYRCIVTCGKCGHKYPTKLSFEKMGFVGEIMSDHSSCPKCNYYQLFKFKVQLVPVDEVEYIQRKFPVMTESKSGAFIFWDMIEPHRRQAARNHGQSLERLAERGGCCPEELCAILEDREYRKMDKVEARERLADLISEYIMMQNMTGTIPGMNIIGTITGRFDNSTAMKLTTDNDPNSSDHEVSKSERHFRLDGSEIK